MIASFVSDNICSAKGIQRPELNITVPFIPEKVLSGPVPFSAVGISLSGISLAVDSNLGDGCFFLVYFNIMSIESVVSVSVSSFIRVVRLTEYISVLLLVFWYLIVLKI